MTCRHYDGTGADDVYKQEAHRIVGAAIADEHAVRGSVFYDGDARGSFGISNRGIATPSLPGYEAMILAGHFPTQRFTRAAIEAMPQCFGPEWGEGMFPPDGYSLWKDDRGRLIVAFLPDDDFRGGYAVRPIIRVPAGRRA